MKLLFTTLDIIYAVEEIRKKILGCRVNNVYDINNKTYLLKLTGNEEKFVLLIESGARVHLTDFDWAKGMMPSGFSMKLRKHIRNRKVSDLKQLGMDRVLDIQFGYEENSFHLIVELYDRGNMCFTDHTYTILHLLRPRTDANHDVRYATHEKYPLELLRPVPDCIQSSSVEATRDRIFELLAESCGPWNTGEAIPAKVPVSKVLTSEFGYGGPVLEHCARIASMRTPSSTSQSSPETSARLRVEYAQHFAEELHSILQRARSVDTDQARGFIFGKKAHVEDTELVSQDEFQPFLFEHYQNKPHISFPTFNQAVDTYFSRIESQKTTDRLMQTEKKASKKLENIKRDHESRLAALKEDQEADLKIAALLENNRELVDNIILMLNHALSNQLDWTQLSSLVEEAKARGDPLASHIVELNLQFNQVTVRLSDPFAHDDEDNTTNVVLDLDLNALNNAHKYYDKRRAAIKKEEKTLIASNKAMKSAALKARQTQREFKTIVQISRVRKPMWFEKFFWFISSENYLVVAGRDALQNEVLVKRYFGPNDIYVHADVHGASSVIVKARPLTLEESGLEQASDPNAPSRSFTTNFPLPPPRTLTEAGIMAVIFSSAWNARVVTNAYWVRRDQVSKTAPSGEYLTTGAFMIRGRKNYLPPCQLIYGFGILFKLDEDSVKNHQNERRVTISEPVNSQVGDIILDAVNNAEPAIAEVDTPSAFPDAELRIDLLKVGDNRKQTKGRPQNSSTQRKPNPTSSSKPSQSKQASGPEKSQLSNDPTSNGSTQPNKLMKRGQRSKLKKIRQKYSEQDEEERLIRMQLLQGESAKLSKQHSRLTANEPASEEPIIPQLYTTNDCQSSPTESDHQEEVEDTITSADVETEVTDHVEEHQEDDGDEEEDHVTSSDPLEWLSLLDSFTGQPLEDDVLLYALPVCAPYSVLHNYKYKTKLTPGTAKRGKAAKLILQHFAMDKSATVREKDLIRVLKCEEASRNLPGSVKVSLTQPKGGPPKKLH